MKTRRSSTMSPGNKSSIASFSMSKQDPLTAISKVTSASFYLKTPFFYTPTRTIYCSLEKQSSYRQSIPIYQAESL